MTANQINYANYLEKVRSDRAQEELKQSELYYRGAELEESKRRTDLQRDTDLKSIESNVLNNVRSTEATRYSANQSAGASIYGSQTQERMNEANIKAQEEVRQAQASKMRAEKWQGWINTGTNVLKAVSPWLGVLKVAG